MAEKPLKIAKALREVSMWVHPEGLVTGAIYVTVGEDNRSQEDPRYVLNTDKPFLVLKRRQTNDVRFYNRAAIVRVEYEDAGSIDKKATILPCRVSMMDGSLIDGRIIEVLPRDHARLYDYLNLTQERFLRLYTSDTTICMVNKSYIIQVSTP